MRKKILSYSTILLVLFTYLLISDVKTSKATTVSESVYGVLTDSSIQEIMDNHEDETIHLFDVLYDDGGPPPPGMTWADWYDDAATFTMSTQMSTWLTTYSHASPGAPTRTEVAHAPSLGIVYEYADPKVWTQVNAFTEPTEPHPQNRAWVEIYEVDEEHYTPEGYTWATIEFGNISVTPYNPTLTCVGFESPIGDGLISVKKRHIVPLRAELYDVEGNFIDDEGILTRPVLQVIFDPSVSGDPIVLPNNEFRDGEGMQGNQFKFRGGQWKHNLRAKKFSAPGAYTIMLESGDPAEYIVDPTCTSHFVIE